MLDLKPNYNKNDNVSIKQLEHVNNENRKYSKRPYRFKSSSLSNKRLGILKDLSSAKCIRRCILFGVSGLSIFTNPTLYFPNNIIILVQAVHGFLSLFFKCFKIHQVNVISFIFKAESYLEYSLLRSV